MSCANVCNTLQELLSIADQLFSASQENVVIYDAEANLVYCNPVLSSLFDGRLKSHFNDNPQVVAKQLKQVVRNVIEQNKADTFLYSAPASDIHTQRIVHDLIYLHPVCASQGTVIAVIGFGRDLDYHASQQQAIIKRQHTFTRALLDTFPFIVWMKDTQGKFLEMNKLFLETIGKTELSEVYGKTDHDFFPADMADGFVLSDTEVLDSGESHMLEESIQKADGKNYRAVTYKAPVKVDGKVIGTVGFARDISLIQALERRVARHNAEYQSLIEHLPVIIVKYDRDCKRIYANALAYQTAESVNTQIKLNVTPAESWNPLITNMSGETYTQKLRHVMQTCEHELCEIHTNFNGQINILNVKIVPEFDEKNQVTGAITLIQNISQSVEYRKKIEFLAYYDSLTELPNRTQFLEKLEHALNLSKNDANPLSVMIIDLDHFKSINDALGHSVGDAVLVAAAKRLKAVIVGYPGVLVARLGGDEFSILYHGEMGNMASASTLAEKIIHSLTLPMVIEEKELFVGASIGISCYPDHADNVGDLLKYADTAMYLAKHQGRNNYQHFKPEINTPVNYAHEIRSQLAHALTHQELCLHYQPIFDLVTGNLVKYEALVRWNSPKLGEVDAEKFIAIAEEFGLIMRLGDWVIKQVCVDAVHYNSASKSAIKFCINLSPRQFLRGHLEQYVAAILQETGCPCSYLEFEITERLLLEQSEDILNTLQKWFNAGIGIALDDFGTGYSSLSYLNKFPITNIKIDKSFVLDICEDEKDATLIKTIIQMGLSLDKVLTAEGIESETQLQLLKSWGCQLGQGYFLGKPHSLMRILADKRKNAKI